MSNFSLQQIQSQRQAQILSQAQLQALNLISLSADDIRQEIYKVVEENPALEIISDKKTSGANVKIKTFNDYTRLSSSRNTFSQEASDNFQAALEAKVDNREPLSDHLLSQLHSMKLFPNVQQLSEKLIYNLDAKGFHILAPESLLEKGQSKELLKQCLTIVQQLDPVGTCTANVQESLYVQAKLKNANDIVLFILDGHLDFINPPIAEKALKKIQNFQNNLKTMFGLNEKQMKYKDIVFGPNNVEKAISFIQTLDPYPARDYGIVETHYIAPDIYIEQTDILELEPKAAEERNIVITGSTAWKIRSAKDSIPEIAINEDFKNIAKQSDNKFKVNLQQAEQFMENLQYRKTTLEQMCIAIVKKQYDFFEKGFGHLKPLTQEYIANQLGVNSSTISRLANEKYLQCSWGLFEINYFFSNSAITSTEGEISQDSIMHQIELILEEHANDKKKLSDQKIVLLLEEKGIHIARRTVAKYRSKMNISSSRSR